MGGAKWEPDDGPDERERAIEAIKSIFSRLEGFKPTRVNFYRPDFEDMIEDALEEAASVADYRAERLDAKRLVAREIGYFNFLRRRQCNS